MKFTSATIDLENNVITMFEQFGEVVNFRYERIQKRITKIRMRTVRKNEIYKPDWKHIVL